MAQHRGDQIMAVGEHIRLDPDVLADDALDGEPPGVDLGPQALHDHADGVGDAARPGGASPLGARGGYGVTPGKSAVQRSTRAARPYRAAWPSSTRQSDTVLQTTLAWDEERQCRVARLESESSVEGP